MMTVLQFSGGKDSVACLYLLRPRWSEIVVVWINTGMAFPETLAQMEEIKGLVPHFHEVKSTQNIEMDGYPADIVPIAATALGRAMEGDKSIKFQSRYSCCAAALWRPMNEAMKALGAKVVIRGQKNADRLSSPIRSGTVFEGIEYQFPLEHWTDADVYAYLREQKVKLPENYPRMNTGLDCWNCTAYLHENVEKFAYMRERHPEKYSKVIGILDQLHHTLERELQPLIDIRTRTL
jgi:phosphoadenosine phosphosulfate reductase